MATRQPSRRSRFQAESSDFTFLNSKCFLLHRPSPLLIAQARAYQEVWAKQLDVPIEQTNSIGLSLILIPPGIFLMGSSPEQVEVAIDMEEQFRTKTGPDATRKLLENETPQHRVTLSRPLLMGSTELTIGQFRRFVEATQYVTVTEKKGGGGKYDAESKKTIRDSSFTWRAPGHEVTDNSPAPIADEDAIAFCNWLSGAENFKPCYDRVADGHWAFVPDGNGYRLPTEAEWEYACCAGSQGPFSFGDDVTQLERYDWYSVCSGRVSHPVGQKLPNPFGLYDMHANVHEWCQDWFAPDYYARTESTDPLGPDSGKNRVTRGGCFYADRRTSRSAHCSSRSTDAYVAFETFGARVVRGLPLPPNLELRKVLAPRAALPKLPASIALEHSTSVEAPPSAKSISAPHSEHRTTTPESSP